MDSTALAKGKNPIFLPPASARVLAIPELLSLVFSFLAHSDIAPTSSHEEQDPELSSFSLPTCFCLCSQCNVEHHLNKKNPVPATGQLSLPSPFAMPLEAMVTDIHAKRRRGEESEEDDDDDEDLMACHCGLPIHRQLSSLFGTQQAGRRRLTKPSKANKPSYNLSNALVCKTWSPIALDVLWRVVDRPERLFALLDGAWGAKLKPDGPGMSLKRMQGLRGLYRDEKGPGRMPKWWEPGVQAFLDIGTEEDDDEDESDNDEENADAPRMVRRREYELFSFRAAPTPASWARFDRYARRVRHLIYTRPCLTESAMNHIAVTRPRLAVFPRMHTLTWVDNPLKHAVLFMHEGVKRFEMRIEVFGREKVDPRSAAEQAFTMYNDLGLNAYSYSGGDDGTERMSVLYSASGQDLKPNRSITRTLAGQLAEIPRRMPNIQTLCISSYIPVSLYLPALLCTVFRAPPADSGSKYSSDPDTSLCKLRTVVLPRFYNCAALLERLAQFPELQVIEYQFDEALGWGRPGDVGLGMCVPESWTCFDPNQLVQAPGGEGEKGSGWFGSFLGLGGGGGSAVQNNLGDDADEGGVEDDDVGSPDADTEMAASAGQTDSPQDSNNDQIHSDHEEAERDNDDVDEDDEGNPASQASSSTTPGTAIFPLFIGQMLPPKRKLGRYGPELVVLASELEPEPEAPKPNLPPTTNPPPPNQVVLTTTTTIPPSQNNAFRKLYDLNLAITITDARDLLLSSPPCPPPSSSNPPRLLTSPALPTSSLHGLPSWPQNLVSLFIDAPPGILATPMEIRALIQAIALACYGSSAGAKPARLERLGIVCSADPDSGYESMCGAYGTLEADGEERYLSMRTLAPLLEVLPASSPQLLGETGGARDEETKKRVAVRPKFALKSFDIIHHFPLYLTQSDVEVIAQTWGSCIEKLSLNEEPIAGFGITKSGLRFHNSSPGVGEGEGEGEGRAGIEPTSGGKRPEATLTLAALLPFAMHCTELKQLGLFLDGSRGVRGLMKPIFHPESVDSPSSSSAYGPEDIDAYTFNIARQYLSTPLSGTSIPEAYPIFRKLERLNLGVSVISVSLDELEIEFPATSDDSRRGLPGGGIDSGNTSMSKPSLLAAFKDSARIRFEEEMSREVVGTENVARGDEWDDEAFFLNYISRKGVRLGIEEEEEGDGSGFESAGGSRDEDSSLLIPMFLAQILPCFPSQADSQTSGAFTTVIGAGTTWSGGPSSLMGTTWAIQKSWTVGEPFEVERVRRRRRARREQQFRQQQIQMAAIANANAGNPNSIPSVSLLPAQIQAPPPPPAFPVDDAAGAGSSSANGTSSVVIPFQPPSPAFSDPSVYLPPLLSYVFRARIKKWLELNESVLPMAVAMREGGRVWGGRVSNELGRKRKEVDELTIMVGVMSGLAKAGGGGGAGAGRRWW